MRDINENSIKVPKLSKSQLLAITFPFYLVLMPEFNNPEFEYFSQMPKRVLLSFVQLFLAEFHSHHRWRVCSVRV